MSGARTGHTATLLPDGKVLVAGGYLTGSGGSIGEVGSAELYDPSTGSWTATGSMTETREGHTATLLPDGKVLVAGGTERRASAELYDPVSGTWSATGDMIEVRTSHTATLLPDGKVLVAGGIHSGHGGNALGSAELYDPIQGTWTATASMVTPRLLHTATLLPDGKVLVAGGNSSGTGGVALASAELFDPVGASWTATESMPAGRIGHTATLLPNGKVLVVGGGSAGHDALTSVELYDPSIGSWTATGNMVTSRSGPTATLLEDGMVLVAGGSNGAGGALASAELYNPASGSWTAAGNMNGGRTGHTATLLSGGTVLLAGGSGLPPALYDPGTGT
jgi:hypothetical protein